MPDTSDTATTTVTTIEHGTYMIISPGQVQDFDGRILKTPQSEVHLCRCGLSAIKPFCDGAHAANDFDGSLTS